MTKTTDSAFLVRVDADRFVICVDGAEVAVTNVLSHAMHSAYGAADRLAQRLRRKGFPMSLVCDCLGQPITSQTLRAALEAERTSAPVKSPLPATLAELEKISASAIKGRMKVDKEFAQRVAQLYS
jgi:hypothetical protein